MFYKYIHQSTYFNMRCMQNAPVSFIQKKKKKSTIHPVCLIHKRGCWFFFCFQMHNTYNSFSITNIFIVSNNYIGMYYYLFFLLTSNNSKVHSKCHFFCFFRIVVMQCLVQCDWSPSNYPWVDVCFCICLSSVFCVLYYVHLLRKKFFFGGWGVFS